MTIARPTQGILDGVTGFVHASEHMLEKDKYSFKDPYNDWEDWDEDDEDRKLIESIRDRLCKNEDIAKEDLDGRILAYEYLSRKYSNRLSHINVVCHALLDFCCDPTSDTLKMHPSFYQQHVAPEQ